MVVSLVWWRHSDKLKLIRPKKSRVERGEQGSPRASEGDSSMLARGLVVARKQEYKLKKVLCVERAAGCWRIWLVAVSQTK